MGICPLMGGLSEVVREGERDTSSPHPSGTPRTGRSVLSLCAGAGEGEEEDEDEEEEEEEGGGVRSVYFTLAEKRGVGGSSAALTDLDFLALL